MPGGCHWLHIALNHVTMPTSVILTAVVMRWHLSRLATIAIPTANEYYAHMIHIPITYTHMIHIPITYTHMIHITITSAYDHA